MACSTKYTIVDLAWIIGGGGGGIQVKSYIGSKEHSKTVKIICKGQTGMK